MCREPLSQDQKISSSLMGSYAKRVFNCGKFAENYAENSRTIRSIASGKGAEILRKVCGNFADIRGNFSAMSPSRTTP